jgi:hypothetical protein
MSNKIKFCEEFYDIKGPTEIKLKQDENYKHEEASCFACTVNQEHYVYMTDKQYEQICKLFDKYNYKDKFIINDLNDKPKFTIVNPFREKKTLRRGLTEKNNYFCLFCIQEGKNINDSCKATNLVEYFNLKQNQKKKRKKKNKKNKKQVLNHRNIKITEEKKKILKKSDDNTSKFINKVPNKLTLNIGNLIPEKKTNSKNKITDIHKKTFYNKPKLNQNNKKNKKNKKLKPTGNCKNIICFNNQKCTYKHNKIQIDLLKSYFDGLFYLRDNLKELKNKKFIDSIISKINILTKLDIPSNDYNIDKNSNNYVNDIKNSICGSMKTRNTVVSFITLLVKIRKDIKNNKYSGYKKYNIEQELDLVIKDIAFYCKKYDIYSRSFKNCTIYSDFCNCKDKIITSVDNKTNINIIENVNSLKINYKESTSLNKTFKESVEENYKLLINEKLNNYKIENDNDSLNSEHIVMDLNIPNYTNEVKHFKDNESFNSDTEEYDINIPQKSLWEQQTIINTELNYFPKQQLTDVSKGCPPGFNNIISPIKTSNTQLKFLEKVNVIEDALSIVNVGKSITDRIFFIEQKSGIITKGTNIIRINNLYEDIIGF